MNGSILLFVLSLFLFGNLKMMQLNIMLRDWSLISVKISTRKQIIKSRDYFVNDNPLELMIIQLVLDIIFKCTKSINTLVLSIHEY